MSDLRVPALDLGAQYARISDEIDDAIQRVVASQRFILGEEVQSLEEEIARYCDVRFAVACASGSDAILLALMAHGIGAGDEVICPTYTFFAPAGCVSRLGATPVFADVDPRTYNVSGATLRAAAERCTKLRAILPVHLYGRAAPMDEILELGRELGVPVVEDAAQAIGARDPEGRKTGSRGSFGCISFFPSKNLGAYGDGGIVTTDDEALAERVRTLRVHGAEPKYHHAMVGMNSRLDAIQAAVLRVKLPHLDSWNAARAAVAALYDDLFLEAGAAAGPGELDGLALPLGIALPNEAPAVHVFNQYVIRVPARLRDRLRAFLDDHKVGTAVYYPLPLHLQECFESSGGRPGDHPAAESAARESLCLPIYPELDPAQIHAIVERVQAFFATA